jgi:pyruvate/2-oxoglutarate dehydrogenase complex dihydrolipoamide dehydrogenase (E3) component
MSELLQPDLCILGGGAAGATLAVEAAARGLSVVLVEKREIGGTKHAVRTPAHALLETSRFLGMIGKAERFGIELAPPQVNFARVQARNAVLLTALAHNETEARLEALNVRIIRARGQFGARDRLDAGGFEIKAGHFVVATGATAKLPSVRGFDLIRPLTYSSLCALKAVPPHLIVLGDDPFGLALAQAFRRFGAKVTILSETKIFGGVDDELAVPVRAQFEREGIAVHEGVTLSHVEPAGEGLRFVLAGASAGESHDTMVFEATHLVPAFGGSPVVEGLGLAAAEVQYDARGIVVEHAPRTSNRKVFAIGAVVRGARPSLSAESEAAYVLAALFGHKGACAMPAVDFVATDPEIAVVGLSEAEARARYAKIRILRWPFSETDAGHFQRSKCGHVKIVTTADGTIVGAGIAGSGAGELINLCSLAISKGMTAAELASTMLPYPVLSDAPRRAAGSFRPGRRVGTWLRQSVRQLCRVG